MPDTTFATLRARLPPGPLADAVQAMIKSSRELGFWKKGKLAGYLAKEAEDLTALLDLLVPMQRSHEAMEALRESDELFLYHSDGCLPIRGAGLADAILAAAAPRGGADDQDDQ